MSFCVLGMSEELKEDGIAVNALWPRTAIATDAIDFIGSVEMRNQSRTAEIMSDAAYLILTKDSRKFTGNFVIDETILRQEAGVANFDKYAVDPTKPLILDFFLEEEDEKQPNVSTLASKLSSSEKSTGGGGDGDVSQSMATLQKVLSEELVKKVNGVYSFKITDATTNSEWYLDLKNKSGKLEAGKYAEKTDCQMTMTAEVFNKMVSGNLKPAAAFMSGKLKIKGNMGLAMKLEKLMSGLKSKL